MAVKKGTERLFKLGDRVSVRYVPEWRGRIVELRGPLGLGGAQGDHQGKRCPQAKPPLPTREEAIRPPREQNRPMIRSASF